MLTVNSKPPISDDITMAVLYAIVDLHHLKQKPTATAIQVRVNIATQSTMPLEVIYDRLIDLIEDDRVIWEEDPESVYMTRKIFMPKIPEDMVIYGIGHQDYPNRPTGWDRGYVHHMDGSLLPLNNSLTIETAWRWTADRDGTDILAYTNI
jgi:hypothetical protein